MTHLYADFRRDWRRWTRSERVTAGAIAVVSLLGSITLMLEPSIEPACFCGVA